MHQFGSKRIAAKTLVALTWRAGSDAGLRKEHDPTLVHHIYDLHETGWHYDTAKVAALTHDVIEADAQSQDMRNPSAKWFMMTSRIATQRWDR
ncbi:hypothetical protein SAMN05216338_100992 [Bradyrhizobium sp. Rc2d]|nr:hypothetical protein SAMN05216338_100992 [Bradyrhizobium sp. Rc2d]